MTNNDFQTIESILKLADSGVLCIDEFEFPDY